MSTIDQRVVQMKFENSKFMNGISSTLGALDKLKQKLTFSDAGKGIDNLNAKSKKFDLSHIGSAVDTIKGKFDALSVAGIAALGALASKAVNVGIQIGKNMTKSLTDGFAEYELKMSSIQTVLANTARHGTKLKDVNREFDALNKYADKTIYSFADMTKNVSLFTNAGIKVEDATSMIKGFSNEAAASGVSAAGAAGAAYQLSQALNTGTIRLMDWRSFTNAGMGGKNMQEGIIAIADAMGTFSNGTATAESAGKDFNGSLEEMWLTADVMSNYLSIMAGDMSEAEMAALGLSKTQIKGLREQAATAEEAATKVRTFSQLMGTLAEGAGSAWTETFEIVIGDFNEATELFTDISNTVGDYLARSAERRNTLLQGWKDLGGRDDIINGFKNIFSALTTIIAPIQKAFREIFPPKTAADLKAITGAFYRFSVRLKMGAESFKGVGSAATVFFLLLRTGLGILSGIGRGLFGVVKVVFSLAAGIGMLIGFIAKAVASFAQWVVETDSVQRIFRSLQNIVNNIQDVIKNLSRRVQELTEVLSGVFLNLQFGYPEQAMLGLAYALESVGVSADRARSVAEKLVNGFRNLQKTGRNFVKSLSLDPIADALENVAEFADNLREKLSFKISFGKGGGTKAATKDADNLAKAWGFFLDMLGNTGNILGKVLGGLGSFFGTVLSKFAEYIKSLDFQDLLALINTGFFIAMYAQLNGFIKSLKNITEGFGGIGESVSDTLDSLSGALDRFGNKETVADKILKIGIALGILAASAYILSRVDARALTKALIAIAVMMAQLAVTMKVMSGIQFAEDSKMLKIGIMLALMAVSINILASAVRKFEGLSWEDLAKGLIGVSTLLAGLALFTKFAEVEKGGIKTGVGLILLGVAINILAKAVEKFGTMDRSTLVQGILTVTALLAALTGMAYLLNGSTGMIQAAVGLLILNASLFALSKTLGYYANLEWGTLVDGLAKVALVVTAMGIALRTMPPNMPAIALGLIGISLALLGLSVSLKMIATMSWEDIAKGLITLAGALGTIAVAMVLMAGTTTGALALMLVTASLYALVPLLMSIGLLPWEVILKGLAALAGIFVVLGLAGLVLTPVVPTLLLLGAAIMLLGAAMLAAGAGMALFGIGIAAVIGAIVSGGVILLGFFEGVLQLLPLFIQQLGLALRAFAVMIRDVGPELVNAVVVVLLSVLAGITRLLPAFFALIARLVMGMVTTLVSLIPRIAAAGLDMIIALLEAIRDRVDDIVDIASDIVVKFIRGLERNLPKIVDAGVDFIVTFITSLADSLRENEARMNEAGLDLANSIIQGMVGGISGGISAVKDAAIGVAKGALKGAMSFLGINSPSKEFFKLGAWSSEGMALGLSRTTNQVAAASESVGKTAVESMRKQIAKLPELIEQNVGDPTIRPVLDLSQVSKDAKTLDSLFNSRPLDLESVRASARNAAEGYLANQNAVDEMLADSKAAQIVFQQHNTSPKALSEVEIYRDTRNLLSLLKEEYRVTPG